MPALQLTLSTSCGPSGGQLGIDATGYEGLPLTYHVASGGVEVYTGTVTLESDLPLLLTVADGEYAVQVTDDFGNSSATRTATVACASQPGGGTGCDLVIGGVQWTPSGAQWHATIYFTTSTGTAAVDVTPLDGVQGSQLPNPYSFDAFDFDSGQQVTFYAQDANGCLAQITLTVPYPGCTSPEADNYDPAAGYNDGTCTFSPKLTLATIPDLLALGRPCPVTLSSSEILWREPAQAQATITLDGPTFGDYVTINGYRFDYGPATASNRFQDGESLLEALLSTPALTADYTIVATSDDAVRLTAKKAGRRFSLTATSTDPATIQLLSTPGLDTYYSEYRTDWGLWLEVWALPGAVFGPDQPKDGALLAGRFEARYREDNQYQFDIAECLRQFTALDYEVASRLTGYFLRFGETFAAQAGGFRRRRQVGESNVLFGLEAVEIVAPATFIDGGPVLAEGFPYELPIAFDGTGSGGSGGTLAGWRRLSRRPGSVPLAGVLTTVLQPEYAGQLLLAAEARTYDGTTTTEDAYLLTPGVVRRVVADPLPADAERVTLADDGTPLLTAVPAPAGSFLLTFANGQGGNESVALSPVREPLAKRTAQTYPTATGRRTYAAELPESYRLSTGLLSPDVYEWLLSELGNSPAVWLETAGGPVAHNITDFDPSADYLSGEYSISLSLEPCEQPARGVKN